MDGRDPRRPIARSPASRYDIEWALGVQAFAYDQKSDGMYPLLTNDCSMSPAQVLAAHKGQPRIEKRFEQLKSVHEIAPVFLKNEARIEALFALYPETRACRRPTTEHILRLFSLAERVTVLAGNQVLGLLGVPTWPTSPAPDASPAAAETRVY